MFLHTHEDEICGLISNESLVASGRTLDKKLARLQRHVTTYFLDAPVIIYHDKPISLAELRQGYQLCEDSKALAFYVGCSAPIKVMAHTVTAQPFHVSQAELSKATAAAAHKMPMNYRCRLLFILSSRIVRHSVCRRSASVKPAI